MSLTAYVPDVICTFDNNTDDSYGTRTDVVFSFDDLFEKVLSCWPLKSFCKNMQFMYCKLKCIFFRVGLQLNRSQTKYKRKKRIDAFSGWMCVCIGVWTKASKGQQQIFFSAKEPLFKNGSSCLSSISASGAPGACLALIYSSETPECLSIISTVHWLFGVESPVRKHALEC